MKLPAGDVNSNMIIRKKMKAKARMGKMLSEIVEEYVTGEYPSMEHTDRLRKNGIHQWTWDNQFKKITKRNGRKTVVELTQEDVEAILSVRMLVQKYRELDEVQRSMVETIILHELRK